MKILLIEFDLMIHGSQSLKDKRSVLKGLLDRIKSRYNVSVAEVADHDIWQRAGIAVVTVSNLESRVEKNVSSIISEIESTGELEILADHRQWL